MLNKQDQITHYLRTHRAHGPSWSPDGTHIAYISNTSGLDQVWIYSLETYETQQLTNFKDRVGIVSWSPNNQHLLATVDSGGNEHDQLYLISIPNGEIQQLTNDPSVIHRFGAWSADGQCICSSSGSRTNRFGSQIAQSGH